MSHWNCNSALCFTNCNSKDESGNAIKYYRLPRDKNIQLEYQRIFKTEGFSWKNGYICAKHWSSGERKSTNDLPDIPVPQDQLDLMKIKFERAKKAVEKAKNPTETQKLALKNIKKKLNAAMSIINHEKTPKSTRRKIIRHQSSPLKKRQKLSSEFRKKLNMSTSLQTTNEQLQEALAEIEVMKQKIKELEKENLQLKTELDNEKSRHFTYKNLSINKPDYLTYMSGLSLEQFDLLIDCIQPYESAMPHHSILFSFQTQFLIVLTICRHGLELRFMAFWLGVSESTVQRIFNSFVIFLATLFNRLDLVPASGFLLKKIPDSFVQTGHGLTDLVIDCTEFKFQLATNYEINSLMFSNYKNTTTGKALIGISPHGMGILFSDVYPGSISDSEITEKSGALSYVEQEHEVMSDRGFSIQDLCAIKGIFLNRPKQKDEDQFQQSEISKNFDISSTRIHVERFIGRVRDWNILNRTWPLNRIDLLTSTWQMLCHIVNITCEPIGPKE